jgi:tyrosine-protein kinase Etk/Wzc
MDKLPNIVPREEEIGVELKRLIIKVLAQWPWFVLSIAICVGISYMYIRYSTPIYTISARLLVNDEKKGGGLMGGEDLLGNLGGLLGSKSSVDNEVEILKTKYLMGEVVKDMNLNISYYKIGAIKDVELYKSPFSVTLLSAADTIRTTSFSVKLINKNQLSLINDDLDTIVAFNKPITLSRIGSFVIRRTLENQFSADSEYGFLITSVDAEVAHLGEVLSIAATNKNVTIIDLSINHPIPKKGEDILNKLIQKYTESNLKDKNAVADSTIKFIQNRLIYISGELGDIEGNIQSFKQTNNLTDMPEQAKLLMQNTSTFTTDLAKTEIQLSILGSLEEYLNDKSSERVIPSSLLPTDAVFTGLVEKYNTLLLDKDRRLLGVTDNNPVIVNLNTQISNLRLDMLASLLSTKDGLLITQKKLKSQINSVETQTRRVPATERNYLNLARQQQIKQELYLFLMQKSEETAISKTSTISNSKTIDPPKSEVKPMSPKKPTSILIGLVLGLLIPIIVIFGLDLTNTKINNKEDILKVTDVPVFGEISHSDNTDHLVIANDTRSAIAEQFRALRTNLAFALGVEKTKVILLTSSMSGEGKSFIAINLGNILAITGKKVLLMELDLRKPGLSAKLGSANKFGFTNYVIDSNLSSEDIVKPLDLNENIFIVNSGPVPPNPAEMLLSARTSSLIADLKTKFDYIIIDAPPIGLVTDAQLMEPYADICLYLVRQKYTDKAQLGIIEDLYRNQKMKKMGIVVNDIKQAGSYGYGYGYGYGTYGQESSDKSWFQSLKSKSKKV